MVLKFIAEIGRGVFKVRFRILGLATIKNIPTDRFNSLIQELVMEGWWKAGTFNGFDAWIDYGKIKLRKGISKLTFEWDNWTEGSVEGPRKIIKRIASKHGFKVSDEWRWS